MKINELLVDPEKPKHNADLLKSDIVHYVDKILGKESSKQDREILQKKLSDDFLEIGNALAQMSKSELTELFTPGKQWEWIDRDHSYADAAFTVGDIPYRIQFSAGDQGDRPTAWDVEFEISRRLDGIDRTKRHGITGTGNSAEVFSTVVDIMRSFLKIYGNRVGSLDFTASEPSRQRLYSAIVNRLLPDWELDQFGPNFIVHRPSEEIRESVNRIPLSDKDYEQFKDLMMRPIPAVVARAYIQEIIDDDELSDNLDILSEQQPDRDVRPLIADWFKQIMPDQLYRFLGSDKNHTDGRYSPLHGYETQAHKGTNDPLTGNAFGRI
jgi:hypothetical protein